MVGTATATEMKIMKEINLEYIVVVLRVK